MSLKISTESIILALICTIDMILTATLVQFRLAVEQNPLMAACIDRGMWFFIAVKLLSFVPFIILVERHRRQNPAFARAATRGAIFLYLLLYVIITIRVNVLA